jgi:aminoglycoside phosphotransferase (APT) family kinase protein
MAQTAAAGVDVDAVTRWFQDHVPDEVAPPLVFTRIPGGRSNLTYEVNDTAGGHWVLRRPPLDMVLPSAHDMGREHRIIAALHPTDVPVPEPLGFCADEAVTGAPFYVMRFVDGLVVRDRQTAERLTVDERRAAGLSLIDVLARLHAVDTDEVGLGDLGRKEGYIERQLRRWQQMWAFTKNRELPAMEEAHRRLSANVPEQGPATVVHGDYRLDNVMIDEHSEVIAVLDWEISTQGDPLADVGLLLDYWTEPADDLVPLPESPTLAEGFPARSELAGRYAAASGRDVTQLDYYRAFGYWKLAAILQGVHVRHAGGAYGDDGDGRDDGRDYPRLIELLAKAALDLAP